MAGIKQNLGEASIDIVAKLDKLESGLKKANKTVDRNTKKMQKTVGKLNASFKTLGKTVIGFASITAGIGFTRSVVQTAISFAKAVADLAAITGATGKDLKFFREEAREIGRTTTKSAVEFLQGIKLIASAKPELLEAKQALVAVTKEVVILSEASGLSLPAAADALTTSLNQFLAPADQAGRFINVMAAGAKFGAAEVPKLAKVIEKAGTVMADANISFEETNALIQKLAQFKSPAEVLGTSLKTFFLVLQTGADETNPKVVGLTKALENLRKKTLTITELEKMFGREAVIVAQQIISVSEGVAELTTKLTGTQEAYEQAIIQTKGLAGNSERAANAWAELNLSIGEGNGLIDQAQGLWADFLFTLAKVPGAFERAFRGGRTRKEFEKEIDVFTRAKLMGLTDKEATEFGREAVRQMRSGIPPGQRVTPAAPTITPQGKPDIPVALTADQVARIAKSFDKLRETGKLFEDERKAEIEEFLRDIGDATLEAEQEVIDAHADMIAEIMEQNQREFEETQRLIQSFSRDAARELSNLAIAGELSAKKIGQAFARLALNAAFNAFVTSPLETFFQTILGGFGGGVNPSFIGPPAPPGKAGGGDIQPNVPVLVHRDEVIVPKMPSTVVSAADVRSGRGGSVTINQTNTFAVDVKNTVRAEVLNAAPAIAQAAKNATIDALNRQ